MAAPNDTQTVAPDYPSPQEIQAALAARGVTAAAAPPPSAGPAAAASADPMADYIRRQLALLDAPPPSVQRDTTPARGGIVGLLGRIGTALAGGSVTDVLSPAQQERAGIRALGDFGTSLMAGSGYYPGKPMFGGLAQGFEGATRSEAGSEQQAAAYLGAQQNWQMEQQKLQLERLKEALPLLTLDQQQQRLKALGGMPSSLGGPAVPGTAAGSGGPASYESAIGGIEGTGKNPRSSASGTGQFLDSTWQDFASANPDLFKGMTPAQVMAAKSDPGLGAKAITWLAQRNAGVLSDNGVTPSGPSLGIAHYVGAAPAAKIMVAPDNAPVAGFVSPEAVKANPELATMTAGQLKQRYANVPNPGFLKPAGGGTASTAPLPAPVQTAGPGAPTGGSTPAAPDTTPWDLPGATSAAPATSTPPTDTTTPPDTGPPKFSYAPTPIPPGVLPSSNLTPAEEAVVADARRSYATAIQAASLDPVKGPELRAKAEATLQETLDKELGARTARTQAVIDITKQWTQDDFKQQQALHAKATDNYYKQQDTQTAQRNALAIEAAKGEEARKTGAAASENSYVLDERKRFATDQDTNRNALNDYQMLRLFSDAAGTSTPIDNLQIGDKTGRDLLVQYGLGTQAQREKWGAQQAFNAVINKSILAARQGVSMGQLSDRDLNFLQHMTVSQMQDPQTRSDIISYLEQLTFRKKQYMDRVEQLWDGGKGLTWGNARTQAEKEFTPDPNRPETDILPNVPRGFDNLPDADKQAFITNNNLKHGSLVRGADGKLARYLVK